MDTCNIDRQKVEDDILFPSFIHTVYTKEVWFEKFLIFFFFLV